MDKGHATQARSKVVSRKVRAQFALVGLALALVLTQAGLLGAQDSKDLAQQIFDTMLKVPGVQPGNRVVHAKGIVCQGTFAASKDAATLSRAAQFKAAAVPLTIRFSDAAPSPTIPDNSPDAAPRGVAVRFKLPNGKKTDIVAFAHNGFVVATGEDFLALQQAVVATDPSKPHPWPVEAFLSTHPAAMKFVTDPKPMPASFATEEFFGNNAFVFVNKEGKKQAVRYQIIPVAGKQYLSDADAKATSPNFLVDELRTRLAQGPAKFRLVVQLANAGDPTSDSTKIWPDDRKTVALGTIAVTSVVADSDAAQKTLAFDPINLVDGIEQSDDPIPALRSKVYMLSAMHRSGK
jgi:catalase